jgi:transcriptional regulator with XRE-family HTH domain
MLPVFYLEKGMVKLSTLRLARLRVGKSQWEVAKETDVPQSTISLYERLLKEPKPGHLEALAKCYGMEPNELINNREIDFCETAI